MKGRTVWIGPTFLWLVAYLVELGDSLVFGDVKPGPFELRVVMLPAFLFVILLGMYINSRLRRG